MNIVPGFGGGGGGGGSVTITGNGLVVHNDGLLSTVPLIGVPPLQIDSPEGLDGPPTIRAEIPNHPLGTLIGANGNVTTDQALQITGGVKYIIRRVVFMNASAAPAAAMAGGLYTLPAKGGRAIVPATQTFAALTDGWQIIDVQIAPALIGSPFLYFTLTTANGAALTLDILVYGDVVQTIEE